MKKLELPVELEMHRKEIESTVKPFIKIDGEEAKTLNYESKFGGTPYLPIGYDYPTNGNGEHLRFIAQINFSEVPNLEPFPKEGILQFYIDTDDLYGLEDTKNGYKVLYHRDILSTDKLIKDFSFLSYREDQDEFFPLGEDTEYRLLFSMNNEVVNPTDHLWDNLLENIITYGSGKEDIYWEHFYDEKHKLGGYAFFTQSDPREYSCNDKYKESILLFQMASIDEGICWGDTGIANFFILEDDLKRLDFTNVLYNWDCS